jgi:hypothetical protein|tara:strand:- start:103 stop:573 length:471 start_codon:yes stop_codon:yes gene_type:complete
MATIVGTQYRENYAAHSWNGEGECPQHWKSKGGNTYLVLNASADEIESVIGHSNDYTEEYIMGYKTVIHSNDVWEDWEERVYYTKAEDGSWLVEKRSAKEGLLRGIKSYYHTYEYANTADCKEGRNYKYSVQYELTDGRIANSAEECQEMLEGVCA